MSENLALNHLINAHIMHIINITQEKGVNNGLEIDDTRMRDRRRES